jgi:hypothetical protein
VDPCAENFGWERKKLVNGILPNKTGLLTLELEKSTKDHFPGKYSIAKTLD